LRKDAKRLFSHAQRDKSGIVEVLKLPTTRKNKKFMLTSDVNIGILREKNFAGQIQGFDPQS
jgi:hypothetical protein